MADVKYDNLSRGRKQQIDLKRREALKKAEAMPESRGQDTAADVISALTPNLSGQPRSSARAGYKSARDSAIQEARDKAEYKDLKDAKKYGDRLYFSDSSKTKDDMSADMKSDKGLKDYRVSDDETDREYKKGGKVKKYAKGGSVSASRRADGIAQRGKTRGRVL